MGCGARDLLLGAVTTPFRVKTFGITFAQFVDIALRDILEREAQHGGKRADIPKAITKFLREGILIEGRRVEEMFFDHFRHFTGFAREPEGGVGELLFVRAIAAKCAGGQFLIVVELHRWCVRMR